MRAIAHWSMFLILSLWIRVSFAQDTTAAVDFELEEETGAMRTLHEVRGRVVILFYENRQQAPLTRSFKLSLREFIRQSHLQDQVRVFGIANLSSVPTALRVLARPVVAQVARQNGVHVLMDWDGVLQRTPFSLRDDAGTVVVIDHQGIVRHRMVGAPTDADRAAFYRALRAAIRARGSR